MEKIFHPEKFNVKNLNPEAEGNVDEGAKFYHSHEQHGAGATPAAAAAAAAAGGAVLLSSDDDATGGADYHGSPFSFSTEAQVFRPPLLLKSLSTMDAPVMGEL